MCFIFAVVEQTETRKRKQQEKPTKQIKTRPTQTLTAAERDDTEPSLSLCRRPQTSTRSLKKKKTSLMMLALLLKLQHVLIIFSAWLQGQSTERSRAAETLQLQTVYKRWPSQAHWSLRVQIFGGNMLVL